MPVRGGRRHVLHLLHTVLRHQAAHTSGHTRLADLLRAAAGQLRRRSTVVLVSDFFSEPGWEKPLGQLALRHEVVAVRLFDPLEHSLPDLGLLPVRDAETGETLMVDTHDAGFRRRFAAAAQTREDHLLGALTRAGVDTLELATDDDLPGALMRFMDMRQRRVRTGAAA